MAGYFISAFDWDKFNELFSPPATKLSEAAADFLSRHPDMRLSTFPKNKAALPAVLAEFFTSEDWYGGKSVEDCEAIGCLLDAIINGRIKAGDLQAKPINDGVYFDLIDLIRGHLEIDKKRSKPRPGGTYFKMTGTENPNMLEFQAFGGRPFRHPSYDRQTAEHTNPYECEEEIYVAMYSIHSPKQISEILPHAEASAHLLDGLGDEELLEEYAHQLIEPLRKAAKEKQAIYVTTDT